MVYTSSRMWNRKCRTFGMLFENGKNIKYPSIFSNTGEKSGKEPSHDLFCASGMTPEVKDFSLGEYLFDDNRFKY